MATGSYLFDYTTRGQFHQRSTHSFYVRKLHAQLFCAYALGLFFTGVSLLGKSWTYNVDEIEPRFPSLFFKMSFVVFDLLN
jgi:hypothetical protein